MAAKNRLVRVIVLTAVVAGCSAHSSRDHPRESTPEIQRA
jgi:hypothetical protein